MKHEHHPSFQDTSVEIISYQKHTVNAKMSFLS